MDREAWQVTVHGIARVGHGLVLSFFLSTSQGVPKTVSRLPEVGERPQTDSLRALRKKTTSGEFLAVQWLGLGAFTARARVQSSVQSLARETPQASIKEQKQQKKKASDFQPPELQDNTFLIFKPPSLWCFVTAARGI